MKAQLKTVIRQWTFWLSLLTAMITQFCTALLPVITQQILDAAVARSVGRIWWLALGYLLGFLVIIGSEFAGQSLSSIFVAKQAVALKNRLADEALAKTEDSFRLDPVSRYQNAYTNETATIADGLYQPLLMFAAGIFGLVFNVLALNFLDPVLMVIVIVSLIIPIVFPFTFSRAVDTAKQQFLQAQQTNTRHFLNIVNGHHVIKNYQAEENFRSRFRRANAAFLQRYGHYSRIDAGSNVLSGLTFYLAGLLILIVGSMRVTQGLITVGTIAGVLQISDQLIWPMQMISDNLKSILGTRQVLSDFDHFVTRRADRQNFTVAVAPARVIALQHINYSQAGQVIIRDLSVEFAVGKHYLIMGESGSGKSTLLNLLKGNIIPDSGTISLPAGLTQQDINLVDATHFVFETSVGNNITLYDDAQPDSAAALLTAGIMPGLAERPAADLSDGQKQRLAILRGLYFDSQVLLLDEATSALDRTNRENVAQLIFDHYPGTIISVMHHVDPDTFAHYDALITIADGQITGVEELAKK
jgi:ABC-type bacteriocin/lantibiotic exporter with double-glycine peptidase domain